MMARHCFVWRCGTAPAACRSAAPPLWRREPRLPLYRDVAVFKRLAGAADWLEAAVAAVLAERQTESVACERPLVLIDATVIRQPGSDGTDWRLHSRYDPSAGFTGFELTDRHGGEALGRHAIGPGEIVVADRGYAHAKGLLHVLSCGADFIVRTGWNSLALRDAEGQRLDLFARLEGLQPGLATDLLVNVAIKGRIFPVRLVVLVKDEATVQAELRRVRCKAQKNQRVGDRSAQKGNGVAGPICRAAAPHVDHQRQRQQRQRRRCFPHGHAAICHAARIVALAWAGGGWSDQPDHDQQQH